MLIDTHCHLNNDDLINDFEEIIKESKLNGVSKFIVIGWDKESSFKAVELAHKNENVFATIGFHPSDIFGVSEEDFKETMDLLKDDKVVALGEIGLDYYWEKDLDKRNLQKEWFKKQIKIANSYGKPICIHNREAFEDTLKILKETKPLFGGVMHCYSGSVEYLKEVLDLGLYIGLDGPVTYKNSINPKEVAKIVPIDRLLLETDCPYLTPHPYRGKINSPVYLHLIAEKIAELKEANVKYIEEETTKNAERLFKI